MKYYSQFQNIKGENYYLEIITDNDSSRSKELILSGDEPITLETKAEEGLYSPIKSLGGTLRIVTDKPYFDLFSPLPNGNKVTIKKDNTPIFYGYCVHNLYSQEYGCSYDILEVNIISQLSYLNYIEFGDYKNYVNSAPSRLTFAQLFYRCLYELGDCNYDNIYMTQSTSIQKKSGEWGSRALLETLSVSTLNFFDDDDDHTSWMCNEVIEEICKFLGMSLVIDGKDLWLLDYDYLASKVRTYSSATFETYSVSSINGVKKLVCLANDFTKSWYSLIEHIDENSYRGEGGEIDIEKVYTKIGVEVNSYPIKAINVDPFDKLADVPLDFSEVNTITETMIHKQKDKDDEETTQYAHYYNYPLSAVTNTTDSITFMGRTNALTFVTTSHIRVYGGEDASNLNVIDIMPTFQEKTEYETDADGNIKYETHYYGWLNGQWVNADGSTLSDYDDYKVVYTPIIRHEGINYDIIEKNGFVIYDEVDVEMITVNQTSWRKGTNTYTLNQGDKLNVTMTDKNGKKHYYTIEMVDTYEDRYKTVSIGFCGGKWNVPNGQFPTAYPYCYSYSDEELFTGKLDWTHCIALPTYLENYTTSEEFKNEYDRAFGNDFVLNGQPYEDSDNHFMDRIVFSLKSDDVYSFVIDDDDAFLLLQGQVAFTQRDRVTQQIKDYTDEKLDKSNEITFSGNRPLSGFTTYKNSSGNGVLGYPSLRVVIKIGNLYYNSIKDNGVWQKDLCINPIPLSTNTITWGQWTDITNRVSYKMGLDDASGFPIKLPQGTKLDGHLELIFYTPYVSGAWSIEKIQTVRDKTNYQQYTYPMFAIIKDIKCEFANKVYMTIKEGYEDDVEYKNIDREIGADKFDNLDLRIHTQPQGKKYSYGSVVYEGNDSYLINTRKAYSSTVQRQELNLIEQYYNHYSKPRIKFTFTTKNNSVKPFYIWSYDNLKSGSYFAVNQQTVDLMMGTNTITIEEL